MARQGGSGLDPSEMKSIMQDVLGIDKPTGKDTSETHDINIKITDTGADGVAKNINKIASAADNADKSVKKLNTSLDKTGGNKKNKTNALNDLNKVLGTKSGLTRALRFSDSKNAKQGVIDAANDYKEFIEQAKEFETIYQNKQDQREKLYSRLKDLRKSPKANTEEIQSKIGTLESKIEKIDEEKSNYKISDLKNQIENRKENLLQQIHAFLAIDDSITNLIDEFDDDFLKSFINDNKQSIIQDQKGKSYTVNKFKETFEIVSRAALENGIETVQDAIQQAVNSVLSNKDDYAIEDLFDNFVENDMMNNDAIINFQKGFKLSNNTKNAIQNLSTNSPTKNKYAKSEIYERIMYDWVQHLKSTAAYNKNDSGEERALLLKNNGIAAPEITGKAGAFFPSDYKKYGTTAIAHSHQYDENINYLRFSDSDIKSLIDPEILANGVNQFLISCGEEIMSLTLPEKMDSDDLLAFKDNVLDFYARAAIMYGGEITADKNGNMKVNTKNLSAEAQNSITDLINYWIATTVDDFQEKYPDMSFETFRLDHESGRLNYNDDPIYRAEEIAKSRMAGEFLMSGIGSDNIVEILKGLQQKYNVQVTTDSTEAEQKVKTIEEKAEKLESEPVKVKVETDAEKAQEDIKEVADKTEELEEKTTKVTVEADTEKAKEELEEIEEYTEEQIEILIGVKDRTSVTADDIRSYYDNTDLANSDDIQDRLLNAHNALDNANNDLTRALERATSNYNQRYFDDFAEDAERYQAAQRAVEYYERQLENLNEELERKNKLQEEAKNTEQQPEQESSKVKQEAEETAESLNEANNAKQEQKPANIIEEANEYDKLQDEIEQTINSYEHLKESKEAAIGSSGKKTTGAEIKDEISEYDKLQDEIEQTFDSFEHLKESKNSIVEPATKEKKSIFKNNEEDDRSLKDTVNNLISDNATKRRSLFAPRNMDAANSELKVQKQITDAINEQAEAHEHLNEVKNESIKTSQQLANESANNSEAKAPKQTLAKRIYDEARSIITSKNDEDYFASADFLQNMIKEAGQDSIDSLKKTDRFKELSKKFSRSVMDTTDLSKYKNIESNIKNARVLDIDSYKRDFLELNQIIDQIREKANKGIDITDDKELIKINQLISKMNELYNSLNDSSRLKSSEKNITALQNRISTILNKYPKMGNEAKEALLNIRSGLDSVNQAGLDQATAQVNKLEQSFKDAGKTGKTFAMTLTERFKSLGTYLLSFVSFYDIIRYAKEGFEIIHQLDDALTEMAKVSDEPLSRLKEFQTESYDIANQAGTTGLVIQQSTADWMRLGETLDDAKESAKDASILLNVSEFESIDEATESLVAMSQAYDNLGKMDIIDKLNNVGNNFSISTDGLATALQLSASSLKTAGKKKCLIA